MADRKPANALANHYKVYERWRGRLTKQYDGHDAEAAGYQLVESADWCPDAEVAMLINGRIVLQSQNSRLVEEDCQ